MQWEHLQVHLLILPLPCEMLTIYPEHDEALKPLRLDNHIDPDASRATL